jgi:hypothetical protein
MKHVALEVSLGPQRLADDDQSVGFAARHS